MARLLKCQLEQASLGISPELDVDRDWPMKSISVSDHAVWAIRSDTGNLAVRVGLGRCRMGLDWVEIVPEGPSKLVSVCVFRTYGFALDDNGHLWFSTGIDQFHPYGRSDAFYKVHTPVIDVKTTNVEAWNIRVSSAGVFLCAGKVMYISRNALSGHKFLREIPPKFEILDNFSLISAGSFNGRDGLIQLCRQNSEIFLYRPTKRNFITVSAPQGSCAIVSLCGVPGMLSVIDSSGRVFHCDGESFLWEEEICLQGPVCSFASGDLGCWAIGCDGSILFKLSRMDIWRPILPPPNLDVVPTQIFCSSNGIYVWLLASGRVFARLAINDRNPSGLRWLETCHTTEMSALAVGNSVVWALDFTGILHRLRGLAACNPAGNYWKPVSSELLRAISIDAQNDLWAIDINNRLVRHLSDMYTPERFEIYNCSESFGFI